MKLDNIFHGIPSGALPDELLHVLWKTPNVRVERIVSRGHSTAPGRWYAQATDEWVMVLTGSAALRLDGRDELLEMGPGDYVLLPAHVRHRVERTDPDRDTVWLAIHAGP